MLAIIDKLRKEKGRPLCIGFSGAGGKTTSLYGIANEILNMHEKVLITTTTKMYLNDFSGKMPIVIRETFLPNDLYNLDICQWFSCETAEGKGLAPSVSEIEKTNEYANIWKLIEIDGSRHRPIKAHRIDEPVYVQGLDLVFGVIGASVVGKPATEDWVCRLETFLELVGADNGDALTPAHILRLIEQPNGLFKDLPSGVQPCVLLTQVKQEDLMWVNQLKLQTHYPIEVIPWQETLQRMG